MATNLLSLLNSNSKNAGNFPGNTGMNIFRDVLTFLHGAASTPANAGALGAIAGGGLGVLNNMGQRNYFNNLNKLYQQDISDQDLAKLGELNDLNQYGANINLSGVNRYSDPSGYRSNLTDIAMPGNASTYAVDVLRSGGQPLDARDYGLMKPGDLEPITKGIMERMGKYADSENIMTGVQAGAQFQQGLDNNKGVVGGFNNPLQPKLDYNVVGGVSQNDASQVPWFLQPTQSLENYKTGINAQQEQQDFISKDKLRTKQGNAYDALSGLRDIQSQFYPQEIQNDTTQAEASMLRAESLNKPRPQQDYEQKAINDQLKQNYNRISKIENIFSDEKKLKALERAKTGSLDALSAEYDKLINSTQALELKKQVANPNTNDAAAAAAVIEQMRNMLK